MIILKRPIITEKTVADYSNDHKVTFEVNLNANKFIAKKAVEETYGVTIESVWNVNRLGKKRIGRVSRKIEKKSPDQKIMKFKLKEGDSIDLFKA